MEIDKGSSSAHEDASESERRKNILKQAKKEAQMKMRSSVLRRNLPRPYRVNVEFSKTEEEIKIIEKTDINPLDLADEFIKLEMVKMMTNDALLYPSKTVLPPKVSKQNWNYPDYSEDELKNANSLLHKETKKVEEGQEINLEEFSKIWENCQDDLIYLPQKKKYNLNSQSMALNDKLSALEYQYNNIEKDVLRQEKKSIHL